MSNSEEVQQIIQTLSDAIYDAEITAAIEGSEGSGIDVEDQLEANEALRDSLRNRADNLSEALSIAIEALIDHYTGG